MPRVSICCGVLNQSAWLEEMIASVMDQTMKDWELIIVDDGSTEDIAAVVEKFDHGGRIRLHRFEENRGIPFGINEAFLRATGQYIKALAADETLWPMALALQCTYLDGNPDIAACFGLPGHGPLGKRPEFEQYALNAQNRSRDQWLDTLLNLRNVPIGSGGAMWRRSLFDKIGYFDKTLTAFSDHEWYCRLVQACDIHVLPYRVLEFRDDPNSVSNSTQDVMRQVAQVRDAHTKEHEPKDGLVTVAIPVKNMPQYVTHAIDSVMAQTYQNFELMVLDDGSTDDTRAVIEAHIAKLADKRITFYPFDENKGSSEALNYMLGQATGDYFTVLSADDIIEPTYLARVQEILKVNPLLDFCASQTGFIGPDGSPFTDQHPFKQIEKATNKTQAEWMARLRHGNVYFGVGTYRVEAARTAGGWRQASGVLADYEMYLALLTRGNLHIVEEDLTQTRITGENMSTKFEPLWLKNTYFEIRKRFYPPRRKLIIATPFYSVSGFSPYIYALVNTVKAITQAGVDFEYWHPSGDAYVQRVKNTILSKFIEDKEATDLLMIDSDMEWEVSALLKMLMLPEELIVGSYPQKNSWDLWTSRPKFQIKENGDMYANQKSLPDGGCLIEGSDLAGGFVLVKRGILERYMEAYPDLRYIDESADPASPNRVYTEFFIAGPMADGTGAVKRFWGEDRTFSKRLGEMGEQWWIYTNITFGHWGMHGWPGNFNDTLLKMRKDAANAPQAELAA